MTDSEAHGTDNGRTGRARLTASSAPLRPLAGPTRRRPAAV